MTDSPRPDPRTAPQGHTTRHAAPRIAPVLESLIQNPSALPLPTGQRPVY